MPLYAYRCTQCGHHFEKIQHFNSAEETECPKCHGKLERPLTAPALQFKGAGWYINDYAPKAASGSSKNDTAESISASADAKPADSSAASTDSKSTDTKSSSSESSASSPSAPSSSDSSSKPATSASPSKPSTPSSSST